MRTNQWMGGALCAVLCVSGVGAGCAGVYELPPPPAEGQRETISLIPGEEERVKEQNYLQARAAVLKTYQFLSAKRFKESLALMSTATQGLLTSTSPQKGASNPAVITLSEGKMVLPSGQTLTFDPAAFILAPDISDMKDTLEGQTEQETARRKELFAMQPDGTARRIVVINEGGRWVIHRTKAPGGAQ